ncbi:histidine phosphatase family protein [Rhodobacter ferrooxidans]|uniref:Phosphoglycerate mutase n=1 Tax=Rhodobacter ferrooxidans TaxID=371731 RepID=C8RWC4_9RHOB|nr:histidine phosphatase family protein [Rhodobacter sp. SW2]EEW26867.1 Phosphoglycerate mutase [Rhodobacter sp. SW2]
MTRLWWVRHGPTHERAFVGWRDVPADLSDAARIARLHAYLPPRALLVSSDLIRASATADAVAKGRQRLPHMPGLREFNLGDWDGRLFTEVAETHPDLSRAYWETPGDTTPPNGESWNAASARVAAAVAQLLADHQGRDIIVVAHVGVILTQVQAALGVSPYQALGHKIDNLSVTRIAHLPNARRAEVINHLP